MSASQIKIMEPGAVGVSVNGAPAQPGGEGERLVVITGQPANITMAVQLLYTVGDTFFRCEDSLIFFRGWNRRKKSFERMETLVCF